MVTRGGNPPHTFVDEIERLSGFTHDFVNLGQLHLRVVVCGVSQSNCGPGVNDEGRTELIEQTALIDICGVAQFIDIAHACSSLKKNVYTACLNTWY